MEETDFRLSEEALQSLAMLTEWVQLLFGMLMEDPVSMGPVL